MALSTDPIKRDCQIIRYKAIKVGMSEEQYKDWLHDQFGVASATELTYEQRGVAQLKLNTLLKATGKDRTQGGGWRDPQIEKLMALWYALGDRGAVQSVERSAMEAWCKKQQPRMQTLTFATVQQLSLLIERLKQWEHRLDKADKAK